MKVNLRNMGLTAFCAMTALAANAKGVVSWLETVRDFGTFREEVREVKCDMRLVNTGDEPLVITSVRPTCGCTAGDYPHGAIAPGDTAAITLTYTSINRPGDFEKEVFVYTNGEPRKSVVTIKGRVIGSAKTVDSQYPVVLGPVRLNASTVPFGDVTKGKTRMGYLTAYNTATDSMRIAFDKAPAHIVPHAVPEVVAPGGQATLTFFYDTAGARQWGINADTIGVYAEPLHASAGAAAGAAKVVVSAFVNEDFSRLNDKQRSMAPAASLSTDKLDFSPIAKGKAVTKEFVIKNTGHDKLVVRRVFSTDKGVTATVSKNEIKKGKMATVRVTVTPDAIADKILNTRLTVMTNDPYSPRVHVRLVGVVAPAGEN